MLDELEASGYLSRQREERPNRYIVHFEAPLRQRGVSGTVGGLLEAVRDAR